MQTTNNDAPLVNRRDFTPEYFHLTGMTLMRGRLFTDLDDEKAALSDSDQSRDGQDYWPNEDPWANSEVHSFVVSLDHGGRHCRGCADRIGGEPNVPQIYAPLYQKGEHHLAIFLRDA